MAPSSSDSDIDLRPTLISRVLAEKRRAAQAGRKPLSGTTQTVQAKELPTCSEPRSDPTRNPDASQLTSHKRRAESRRAEKEAELQAKRRRRVQEAFSRHEESASGQTENIQIIASESLFNDHTKKGNVLNQVRELYRHQLVSVQRKHVNLITWKRAHPGNALSQSQQPLSAWEDVPIALFVFHPENYLQHLDRNTLYECAEGLVSSCAGSRIIFAVPAMDNACRTHIRRAANRDDGSHILHKSAVQDSYAHLYTNYSIRIHDTADIDELADYIRDLSDAIAAQPYYRPPDFLKAYTLFRDAHKRTTERTVVVDTEATLCEDHIQYLTDAESADFEEDEFGYDFGKRKEALTRLESRGDLGNVYLKLFCLIPGVSVLKAQAIRLQYPTLRSLLDAYDACQSSVQRDLLLSELRYGGNNRRIGPSLSTTIASILTTTHPATAV